LVLAHAAPARAAPAVHGPVPVSGSRPSIDVRDGGWGSAEREDIEAVLQSVAGALIAHLPGRRLDPIIVRHTNQYPVVVYDRGPRNEYQVYLTATDRRWGQYVYQFAHELTHILSNYERRQSVQVENHNQWFEETLCEVASLWALRRLATDWQAAPPSPRFAGHAPELVVYADEFLHQPHRRLPAGMSPADFMRKHETLLRREPYLRQHNELVANLLLPMFEEDPRIWEAVGYLNLADRGTDFWEYMRFWYADAPDGDKDIIRQVMALLGVEPGPQEGRPSS
jgi:hypothetical protein